MKLRRTYGASESALASAAAEVAAAQQRTRDIELERRRLEGELADLRMRASHTRAATVSALVSLIRSAGVGVGQDVTNILIGLYRPDGWHKMTPYCGRPDGDDDDL